MKTTTILLVCATLATGVASLQAENPKHENATAKPKAKAVAKRETKDPEKVATEGELTGSRLKTTYRKNGMITDGPNQVAVLDQKAIEYSGASDLRELLIRKGLRR